MSILTYTSADVLWPLFALNVFASIFLVYAMFCTYKTQEQKIYASGVSVVLAFFICIDAMYLAQQGLYLVHMALELIFMKIGLYKVWGLLMRTHSAQ